ncbi:MAG: alpha/beta hydrolase [Promethearchaeota archaeon]
MTGATISVDDSRYRVDTFHAVSLEGNPLGSPVDRDVAIYLPPSYFDEPEERYPVVYFLHGYSGNNKGFTVYSTAEQNPNLPVALIPSAILEQIDVDRLPSYQKFDALVEKGHLPEMIFVQPDGSLHQPNVFGMKSVTGSDLTKGSFYVNSPNTGNYEDYILEVIQYVDTNYRTKAVRSSRIIAGGSMGGYGALRLGLRHPQLFHSAIGLSPADMDIGRHALDYKLRIPIYNAMLGPEVTANLGDSLWGDILDTLDLIWSKERTLLASIKRDEEGRVVSFSQEAGEYIRQGCLTHLLEKIGPSISSGTEYPFIYLSCAQDDEFGLAPGAEKLHLLLEKLGLLHTCDFYEDPKAKLTPHILGIAYQVIPSLQYCLLQAAHEEADG